MVVDSSRSSFAVRQFQRIWAESDYRRAGHVGSGIYAVNEAGRARWGAFPDVIADDRFVQQRFLAEERITLDDHSFTIYAPKDMKTHIRRATRIEVGNQSLSREVAAGDAGCRGLALRQAAAPRRAAVRRSGSRCRSTPTATRCRGCAPAGLIRRGTTVGWARDASSRTLVDA